MKKNYFIIPLMLTLILLFNLTSNYAQSLRGTVKGKIATSDNKPANNISVVLEGTKFGTATNENGEFSFKAPAGLYKIKVSSVGVQNAEVPVSVVNGQTVSVPVITINVSGFELNEVNISTNKESKMVTKRSPYVAKMPLNNLENPQVYTSISKELLTQQINTNFNDALKNTSGLDKLWTSTGRSGDGAAYYTLRGFTIQPTLIDGIAGLTNGDLDPANIERIEVIKGPSGTLYGGALTNFGGLINVVTKHPIDTLGGQIGYTTGNYSLSRLTADIYGSISKDKKFAGRVNAAYNYQNSFQDAGFNKSFFVAPSFEYRANDKLTLNLNAEFYNYEGTNPLSIFLNRTRQLIARTPDQLNFNFNRSYTSNDVTVKTPTVNVRGQASYKFAEGWVSQTNFSRSYRKTDGWYQYVSYSGANDTSLYRIASLQNSISTVVDLQQNFIGDFKIASLRNRLVLGLDFLNQITNNNNSPYFLYDQVSTVRNNDSHYIGLNNSTLLARLGANTAAYTKNRTLSNVYSVYASDVLNITDQLLAMASLRIDRFDNLGTYNIATATTTGKYKQTSLSPKFGLIYQLVKDQVSLFGNYMNGFRNVAPVIQPLADVSGVFKPQHANQVEGGVKLDAFKSRLNLTASYYDISVKDVTRSDALVRNGQTYNITVQDGEQKSKGFEMDLIANPVVGLDIVGGFSHNLSKLTKSDPTVDGRRPVGAGPDKLLNTWISYTQTKGKLTGLGVGFGGNYASDNVITNSSVTGTFTLPSYTVLNATTFYNTRWYRIGIKVDNLANKRYYKGWTTVEPQLPRSLVANLTFKL